jgi:hypothetical protein
MIVGAASRFLITGVAIDFPANREINREVAPFAGLVSAETVVLQLLCKQPATPSREINFG